MLSIEIHYNKQIHSSTLTMEANHVGEGQHVNVHCKTIRVNVTVGLGLTARCKLLWKHVMGWIDR